MPGLAVLSRLRLPARKARTPGVCPPGCAKAKPGERIRPRPHPPVRPGRTGLRTERTTPLFRFTSTPRTAQRELIDADGADDIDTRRRGGPGRGGGGAGHRPAARPARPISCSPQRSTPPRHRERERPVPRPRAQHRPAERDGAAHRPARRRCPGRGPAVAVPCPAASCRASPPRTWSSRKWPRRCATSPCSSLAMTARWDRSPEPGPPTRRCLSVLHPLDAYDGGTTSFIRVLDKSPVVDLGYAGHPSLYRAGAGGLTVSTSQVRQAARGTAPPQMFTYLGTGVGEEESFASTGTWRTLQPEDHPLPARPPRPGRSARAATAGGWCPAARPCRWPTSWCRTSRTRPCS